MAKVKRTYTELLILDKVQNKYLEEHSGADETKLCANIRNVQRQLTKINSERSLFLSNLHIDYCMVEDKTQRLLKDKEGNPEYSKKGMKDRDQAISEYEDHEFELDSRIIADFKVSVLTPEQREAFSGIYIPELAQDEDGVFIHEINPKVLAETTITLQSAEPTPAQ